MKLKQFFLVFVSFIALSFGYLVGRNQTFDQLINSIPLIQLVIVMLIAVYTQYIHIMLHESGHFLFGKLTGYRLVFFQLSNIRYDAINKKIRRMSINQSVFKAQCVMTPSTNKKGLQTPYFLYLAGGLLVNLITAVTFYTGSFFLQGIWSFSAFALSLPPFLLFFWYLLEESTLIRTISQSERAKKIFLKELNIKALLEAGQTFEDLPADYFDEIEQSIFTESRLGEYLLLVAYQRQLSVLDFEKAEQLRRQYDQHWNFLQSPYARKLASANLFLYALFGRYDAAKKLSKQIDQRRELKTYYEQSIAVQAAYSFFIKIDINQTKQILKNKSALSQISVSQAELQLQKKLLDWLKEYID
ncbi:hypothetical protein [Jeotgalibaca dankookensis]|uniref:hypothetical protein n=1 Tax=Jeotgalibaca dankookensis TaxID=708126 RepID=UPI0007836D1D|nr:hypothetical protein [Jeotgalibaca dankookensis]